MRTVKVFIPIKLQSPNVQEHWTKKHRRNKRHQHAVALVLRQPLNGIKLPAAITLTRVASRHLDYDNMVYSFKAIRDQLAVLLTGVKKMGQGDSDPRITWRYDQERQAKGQISGISITVEET